MRRKQIDNRNHLYFDQKKKEPDNSRHQISIGIPEIELQFHLHLHLHLSGIVPTVSYTPDFLFFFLNFFIALLFLLFYFPLPELIPHILHARNVGHQDIRGKEEGRGGL